MVKATFTFRVSDEIRERIEAVAAARNQSIGSLIEMILRDWLDEHAAKKPKK